MMSWLLHITYVPTDEGWLYVASHKDLFTSNIVGTAARWTMEILLDKGLKM